MKLSAKSARKIASLFNVIYYNNRTISEKLALPKPLSDADQSAIDNACESREHWESKLFQDFGIAAIGSPFWSDQTIKRAAQQIKSRPSRARQLKLSGPCDCAVCKSAQ